MRQAKKGKKIDAMLAAVLVFYLLVQIALFLVMTHRNSPLHECVQIADIPIAGRAMTTVGPWSVGLRGDGFDSTASADGYVTLSGGA
jgi:hypothetical protein